MRLLAFVLVLPLAGCSLATDPTLAPEPCPESTAPVTPTEYERKDWGRWNDEDKDCQDTRQEVLIRDSSVDVTLDERGCKVVAGKWIDPYDGSEILESSKVDVDHVIALQDAHESGGWQWSYEEKRLFANDLSNLKASSQSTNRSKGARGPDEWLPPLDTARCSYIEEWVGLKEGYELGMGEGEYTRITYMMEICSQGLVPPLPQG